MKRGLIMPADVFLYAAIVLAAALIFVLFYIQSVNLKESKFDDTISTKFSESAGTIALQSYLRMPLNVDAKTFIDGEKANYATENIRMADALRKVVADQKCMNWLKKIDESRKNERKIDDSAPDDSCRIFFDRTELFLNSLCADYTLTIFVDKSEIGIRRPTHTGLGLGSSDIPVDLVESPLLSGRQSVPGEPPFTLQLDCRERFGVVSS